MSKKETLIHKHITLPSVLAEKVSAWRKEKGFNSDAEAIRGLLRIALENVRHSAEA